MDGYRFFNATSERLPEVIQVTASGVGVDRMTRRSTLDINVEHVPAASWQKHGLDDERKLSSYYETPLKERERESTLAQQPFTSILQCDVMIEHNKTPSVDTEP